MPTDYALNDLLEAAEHWFDMADDENELVSAAQYALIASAGAQLAMAKLATKLHAASLREQPTETAQQSDLTTRLLKQALKALRIIADLEETKQEPEDSWREVLFRTITFAQRTVDKVELEAAQYGLNLEISNGTSSDS